MNSIKHSKSLDWGICIFMLLFIFSPVLTDQPDGQPGAIYVVSLALPIIFLTLRGNVIKSKAINAYAFLFFLFAIVSTLFSEFGSFNFRQLSKYFLFVVLFACTSSYALPRKQLKFVFVLYLYMSVALSILIILSFIYGYQHIETTGYQGRYSIGITGIFKNPNYLTSFYNLAFMVICYILATVKIEIKKEIFLYVILVLFLISSYLTGTRAALLVEVLILVSLPIVLAKRIRLYKVIPLAIIVLGAIIYFYENINMMLTIFLGNRDAFSDVGRSEAWSIAYRHITDNLFLGCGHNSWSTITNGSGYLEYLHNIFLELVLDQGLIGLCLIIGVIFTGYRETNNNDKAFLMLFLFASAFPMFFQNGLYEVNFWRFIIINRLLMSVSATYKGGIYDFLQNSFGVKTKYDRKRLNESLSGYSKYQAI